MNIKTLSKRKFSEAEMVLHILAQSNYITAISSTCRKRHPELQNRHNEIYSEIEKLLEIERKMGFLV